MPTEHPLADFAPPLGSAPVGHRGARAAVLRQLKRDGDATATDLAQILGCSVNAVRHHLKELEADGSVVHERTHHGVGAPIYRYRLSAQGHQLFPDRYAGTVTHLLDHIESLHGRTASLAVLQEHFGQLGTRLAEVIASVSAAERGDAIARLLDREGFMATWEATVGGGTLTHNNCPHRVVAERFPEVCAAEERLLGDAFGGTVERHSRIASGCGCCRYQITLNAPARDAS